MCGLKLEDSQTLELETEVTPFVGVWIETLPWAPKCTFIRVTPFVGVWIETCPYTL